MLKYIIIPWMTDVENLLIANFISYMDQTNLVNVSIFTSLLVSIILLYFLVWKNFEDKLLDSVNFINNFLVEKKR